MIFQENFENGVSSQPVLLTNYHGAQGMTYTADAAWLEACNGDILEFASPDSAQYEAPINNCAPGSGTQDQSYDSLRQLAWALGTYTHVNPITNHVVAAYTSANPGADKVQLATQSSLSLPGAVGHFVAVRIDTAALNCYASAPLYDFSITQGTGSPQAVGNTINACGSSQQIATPPLRTSNSQMATVGTYVTNGSVLVTNAAIGLTMRNANGSGGGNDAAFDNLEILDATPQLDKSFSPSTLEVGGTSTLTFTVTNSSELASKNGWGFTDHLPAGLTVASPASLGGTCTAEKSAQAGDNTVTVQDGELAAGQASCTITVAVTSQTSGAYTNGPGNMTETGLNPPANATVSFTAPSYSVTKTASATTAKPGAHVTYTVAVKNTGAWAYGSTAPAGYQAASFADDLTGVLDDATYNGDASMAGASSTGTMEFNSPKLTWTGPLAVGATVTVTYSVTVKDPDSGNRVLSNVVAATGPGGSCSSAASCSTTTTIPSGLTVQTGGTAANADTSRGWWGVVAAAGSSSLIGWSLIWFRRRSSRA